MSTVTLINDLQDEFQELANLKPSASRQRRIDDLDEALDAIYDGSEELPRYKQLRVYFAATLIDKSNWGSKEVISKLTYSINKVYSQFK